VLHNCYSPVLLSEFSTAMIIGKANH